MSVLVLQADARHLPLPDSCVDLVITSPPYFGLRSYTDGGQHYDGQIGSESTPAAYIDALVACTREWVRVLKPSGSLFINLGDKYGGTLGGGGFGPASTLAGNTSATVKGRELYDKPRPRMPGTQPKSLLGLPWRYALACIDQLGLILRAEIVWAKPNGLPESVTDRVRRAHEQVFHFTVRPRYYSAVDEIRLPAVRDDVRAGGHRYSGEIPGIGRKHQGLTTQPNHPLGTLPGSVWSIPSQPLTVPPHLGVDHFAAFPMELPRRLILGWSPAGVCTGCGEGRRPVTTKSATGRHRDNAGDGGRGTRGLPGYDDVQRTAWAEGVRRLLVGQECACGHFDARGVRVTLPAVTSRARLDADLAAQPPEWVNPAAATCSDLGIASRASCHSALKHAPLTTAGVVLDPFGGTGTTALLAAVNGRNAVTVDRSADYCRIATWRTTDPGERARAMLVPKPEPVHADQASLFDIA